MQKNKPQRMQTFLNCPTRDFWDNPFYPKVLMALFSYQNQAYTCIPAKSDKEAFLVQYMGQYILK
jgi:hypothetical protein